MLRVHVLTVAGGRAQAHAHGGVSDLAEAQDSRWRQKSSRCASEPDNVTVLLLAAATEDSEAARDGMADCCC